MSIRLIGILGVVMVIVSILFECYHKGKVMNKEAYEDSAPEEPAPAPAPEEPAPAPEEPAKASIAVKRALLNNTQKKQSYVSTSMLATLMKSVTTRFSHFSKQLANVSEKVKKIDDIDSRLKIIEADMNQKFE